ncbi:hypothetical protein F5Y17DRAFT_450540 [Xylariaceae sp. FL0594]|nr:hypothetical protein F5Y17DRAFT_450540 [Xylariaceae sp. FL0594]
MVVSLIRAPRGIRILLPLSFFLTVLVLVGVYHNTGHATDLLNTITNKFEAQGHDDVQNNKEPSHDRPPSSHPLPKYKPTVTLAVPTITDPFPLLASSTGAPPPIPEYNVPKSGLHRDYGLGYMPPLFIGFTRQWPMLLQCVVSYLAAGWPPESIYVVENTGVHNANANGKLTLQNPFYLNHTTLRRLGVNVIQTPVLLTFSQLQNFFLSTAASRSWPHYFYSHQDVLAFSFEDGPDTINRPGDREWFFYNDKEKMEAMRPAAARQPGYRTIYENCLREINQTLASGERWAFRWFQYDHLTLVNREALEAVGGWDSLIPYYGSDCDMNARLEMDGWTMRNRRVGIINDVSTVLEDLAGLYRDPKVIPSFFDPNPVLGVEDSKEPDQPDVVGDAPKKSNMTEGEEVGDDTGTASESENEANITEKRNADSLGQSPVVDANDPLDYFRTLLKVADEMGEYKYRNRDLARNSWQGSQHGGSGEPYYYNPDGFSTSFWILAEAGREVFSRKWGHRDCNLVEETALKLGDQWLVEADWEDAP